MIGLVELIVLLLSTVPDVLCGGLGWYQMWNNP